MEIEKKLKSKNLNRACIESEDHIIQRRVRHDKPVLSIVSMSVWWLITNRVQCGSKPFYFLQGKSNYHNYIYRIFLDKFPIKTESIQVHRSTFLSL